MQPWFLADPARLQRELNALEAAGLAFTVDADQRDREGILTVTVSVMFESGVVDLEATYPDLFPYFKPFVEGPDLGFSHHYNPETREYCLLRTGQGEWRPASDTLAWLLTEQWGHLVAANAADVTDATGAFMELAQAEPISVYVPTTPGEAIVLGGSLEPGTAASGSADLVFTAANPLVAHVACLLTDDGQAIGEERWPMTSIGGTDLGAVRVRWVRVAQPPRRGGAQAWWEAALASDPGLERDGWHNSPRGQRDGASIASRMQIVLITFPEERGHREEGAGWLAVVRRRRTPRQPGGRPHLVRVIRAGHGDLFEREPRLRRMGDSKIILVGLGGLGGPIATLLGCTAPAQLSLWDGDAIDPATAIRVPGAFAGLGHMKTTVLANQVHNTQPYTVLQAVSGRLGQQRGSDKFDAASHLMDNVEGSDLVIDATADMSVQHLLSDTCRTFRTAYLRAEALPGVWSGLIALQRPEADVCWMCWQHALMDGTLPRLPRAGLGAVQPLGCASPTYTGAGFDLSAIAAQTVRVAAAYLTGADGYGELEHDVMTVRFRDDAGVPLLPQWSGHNLARHPDCPQH